MKEQERVSHDTTFTVPNHSLFHIIPTMTHLYIILYSAHHQHNVIIPISAPIQYFLNSAHLVPAADELFCSAVEEPLLSTRLPQYDIGLGRGEGREGRERRRTGEGRRTGGRMGGEERRILGVGREGEET